MQSADLVYTWVNPDSAEFAEERARWARLEKGPDQEYRAGAARHRDNGELILSIDASLRFLPFLRKVWIIGAGGRPDWLARFGNQVHFVPQEEIVSSDVSPTFSSDCIESYISDLPDLAEHYLYANDDYFIGARHNYEDWYTVNGRCIVAISARTAAVGDLNPTFRQMEINSVRSLKKNGYLGKFVRPPWMTLRTELRERLRVARLGVPLANTMSHVTLPYIRSEWDGFRKAFPGEIACLRQRRFRSEQGVAINLMYFHYLAARGRAEFVWDDRHGYLDRRQSRGDWERFALSVNKGEYTRYCLNDAPAPESDGWPAFIQTLVGGARAAPTTSSDYEAAPVS